MSPTPDETDVFSSRAVVRMGDHGTFRVALPCDDGTGGVLQVFCAVDGDLHFSMRYDARQPNALDGLDGAFGVPLHMAHVRLRSGMGGGANPALWLALAKALRALVARHGEKTSAKLDAKRGTRRPVVDPVSAATVSALADTERRLAAALREAVAVVYFRDSADYLPALWTIIRTIDPAMAARLEADAERAYESAQALCDAQEAGGPTVAILHRRAMEAMDDMQAAERAGMAEAARDHGLAALEGEVLALRRFVASAGSGPTGHILARGVREIAARLTAHLAAMAEREASGLGPHLSPPDASAGPDGP